MGKIWRDSTFSMLFLWKQTPPLSYRHSSRDSPLQDRKITISFTSERERITWKCDGTITSPPSMNIDSTISLAPRFPVSLFNFSLQIKGNETDIIISRYEDHLMVIATQIGTMGTILHARKEEGMSINPTFNVSVIFGKRDEPMLIACARQLIEHMSLSGFSRPLVLSFGLKDHSAETLKGIISAVIDKRVW